MTSQQKECYFFAFSPEGRDGYIAQVIERSEMPWECVIERNALSNESAGILLCFPALSFESAFLFVHYSQGTSLCSVTWAMYPSLPSGERSKMP